MREWESEVDHGLPYRRIKRREQYSKESKKDDFWFLSFDVIWRDIFELVLVCILGEILNFSLAGMKQELNNFVLFPFF